MNNYKVLLILIAFTPYIYARIPNRNVSESNSRELSGDWELNLDDLTFTFVNKKIMVSGSVKATNVVECGVDMIEGKVSTSMQCKVIVVVPIASYFDSDKADGLFGCAAGAPFASYESSLPMYFACAVFDSNGKVVKWKSHDLFKEKTGYPVWVIWLGVAIVCAVIVVLLCSCCCKCCC